MSFRGQIGNIGLADIFQNIAANRLTGTLRIFSEKEERFIYFGAGEITLFSPGSKKQEWVAEVLVKQQKINDSQKLAALKTKRKTRKHLKVVLDELKLLTQQDFSHTLQKYMEEEIYEVFYWKKAEFAFEEGTPPPVFDEDLVAANIKIDSYTVIMEAARRLDEWDKIRKQITSPEDIFQAVPEANPANFELHSLDLVLLPLLDGSRTLQQITDSIPYGKFDIYRSIYDMMEMGLVRPIRVDELVKLVDRYLGENRRKEAIQLLKKILERERNNLEARQRLAECLEQESFSSEAAEEYKILAYHYLSDHEVNKAVHYYRRVVVLDPTDTSTQEKLLSLYLERNRMDRALLAGRALASTYQELEVPAKACKVYENLLQYEEKPEIHLLIAKAYIIANQNQEGLKHYYQAARLCLKEGEEAGALEAYELAKGLEPSPDNEAARKIEDLRSGRYHRRKQFIKRLVLALIFVPLVAGLIFYSVYELSARYAYQKSLSRCMKSLYSANLVDGYYSLYPLCKAYPYSLVRGEAEEHLKFLGKMALEEAEKAEREGEFVKAFSFYQNILHFPILDAETRKKAKAGYKKWKERTSPLTEGMLTTPHSIKKDNGPGSGTNTTSPTSLPLLKANRRAIDAYWQRILQLVGKKHNKEAKEALQKLIPFLEEQPKKLKLHYYLEKSKELLERL